MELKIIATSDMHGYIMPTDFIKRGQNLGFGTAKVASLMKKIRAGATGPVLAIENGDFIQGSPLSHFLVTQSGHSVTELTRVVNALDYDCHILGNHEFNNGLDYLQTAIDSYAQPTLCANLLNAAGEPFFGRAYEIIEKDGVKIAVLGLTTQYIPHWENPTTIKDITFASVVETAEKYVPELRKLADVVVVAYHGGFERDLTTGEPTEALTGENEGYELLERVQGIDALITGHQHREIAAVINGVPVIQPGYRGAFVGEITLTLEKMPTGFVVVDKAAKIIPTASEVPDAEVSALVAALSEEVETWLDQPCGKVIGDMTIHDAMAARTHEHPYVEFINRVQMAASGVDISGTALFNNEGRGFNDIITMRDIFTNYIYVKTLAVLRVSGADLLATLEKVANYLQLDEQGKIVFNPAFIEPKPQYYNYDMYEGIDYTIDLRRPAGSRITQFSRHGAPIKLDEKLDIVINQYRAVGGGNYAMFSADKIIKEIQVDMTELIADYLAKHPVIEATVNHNFTVLS